MGVIIAALATVTGIVAFKEKMEQSEMEHIVDRNVKIASAAAFWKSKLDPFSGGNASYDGLETNGLAKIHMLPETHHARYEITQAAGSNLVITGVSIRFPEIGARTYVNMYSVDSTALSFVGEFTVE